MDRSRAEEILNGVIINVDSETEGPFVTGGPSSPIGNFAAVAGDLYVQSSSKPILFQCTGPTTSDWRQLDSTDLPFDPTGLLNFESSDTSVDLALQRLGNFSVSDLTEAEGFTSSAQETTTSNGWVSKSGFPVTTSETKTAGQFSLRWSASVGQTKNGRNFGFQVLWRPTGGVFEMLSEVQMSVSDDNSVLMQSGFKEVTLASDNTIEIDVQHGQTTDGFASIIENVSVEVRRIGD